jgi:hypothetical protein
MGQYKRVTRECTIASLRPELADAIQAHVERYELESALESMLICCETISTKETKKLFGKKTEIEISGVILTPKWLIWAAGKENEKAGVLSARVDTLRVEDYEQTKMYQIIQDTGLNVFGFPSGHESGMGSIFIGLGSQPAAGKFREILKEGIK